MQTKTVRRIQQHQPGRLEIKASTSPAPKVPSPGLTWKSPAADQARKQQSEL